MPTKFPLQINDLKFFVNPTGINVNKALNFSALNTQAGVKYQVWYDAPEVVTITGQSAGDTAYKELAFLKRNFERTNKQSTLFYKTRIYRGLITSLVIDHNVLGHPNRFNYSITFQLLSGEQFAVEDFPLTRNERGSVAKFIDRIENSINKRINIDKLESKIDNLFGL